MTSTMQEAATTGLAAVESAQQEVREAGQLLAALEERVRQGDPGVRPAELRDARELVEFARLRVESAERNAAQLATQARHALHATLGAEARAIDIGASATIADLFTDALTALTRLQNAAEKRSATLRGMAGRAAELVQLADEHGERDVLRAAGVHNASRGGLGEAASVAVIPADGGTRYRLTDVPARHVAAAVLARAGQPETVNPDGALTIAARVFPNLATAIPSATEQGPGGHRR